MTPEELLGFHQTTALLESVGWDEEALKKLVRHVSEYISHISSKEAISQDDITILFLNVEDNWGVDAKETLKSIFNIETFYLNLNNQGNKDVN